MPSILSANHSFAPRMLSGSAGAWRPTGKPALPAIDSAAARNQDSNSLLARTTATGIPARTFAARANSAGPSCAGQSSSLSRTTRTPPPPVTLRAASSTALSNSPGFTNLLFGVRNGEVTCTMTGGTSCSAIRRTTIGTASMSPCPSTTQAIRLATSSHDPQTVQLGSQATDRFLISLE